VIGSRILGTGSYTPSNIVYNKDIENIVDTSDNWNCGKKNFYWRRYFRISNKVSFKGFRR